MTKTHYHLCWWHCYLRKAQSATYGSVEYDELLHDKASYFENLVTKIKHIAGYKSKTFDGIDGNVCYAWTQGNDPVKVETETALFTDENLDSKKIGKNYASVEGSACGNSRILHKNDSNYQEKSIALEGCFFDGLVYHNWADVPSFTLSEAAALLWDRMKFYPKVRPRGIIPIVCLNADILERAEELSVWRIGHSTVLMKFGEDFVITDPIFSERASPVQFMGPARFSRLPITISELPRIKLVLISHNHYDHLDLSSICQLAEKVDLFAVPARVGKTLVNWGVSVGKIREFIWWEEERFMGGALKLIFTPAQHESGRGLHDHMQTLWGSWCLVYEDKWRIFFSGDGGYNKSFKLIGMKYGPFDLTLLEAGQYSAKHWPFMHCLPEETVQAHQDLGGNWLLPIHNSTFDLSFHPWSEPFERVTGICELKGLNVTTPKFGEVFNLKKPKQGDTWWRAVDSPKLI